MSAAGSALYVRQLELGPMQNFVYLVGAQGAHETAVVDGAWDIDAALAAAAEDGRTVTHALVTHHHHDHTNGLEPLLARAKVRVFAHAADAALLSPEVQRETTELSPGEVIDVGPLQLRAMHTPGHTPGSTCYALDARGGHPAALFTGDTLFVNACGRCDLPGGDAAQMFDSLGRIAKLPGDTVVYPGHDYGDVKVSDVARERERNPYFARLHSQAEFVAFRMRPRR